MATTTDLGRVRERSTGLYTATLTDENGAAIVSLLTLTISLYDVRTGTYINNRQQQDALNANNVTFSAGTLTWAVQAADHQMVGARAIEEHRAVFEYTWIGSKRDWHAVEFTVESERAVS